MEVASRVHGGKHPHLFETVVVYAGKYLEFSVTGLSRCNVMNGRGFVLQQRLFFKDTCDSQCDRQFTVLMETFTVIYTSISEISRILVINHKGYQKTLLIINCSPQPEEYPGIRKIAYNAHCC